MSLACSEDLAETFDADEFFVEETTINSTYSITANKASLVFDMLGDTLTIDITSNGGYEFTLPEWLELTSSVTKSDTSTTIVHSFYAPFNNTTFREGNIVITSTSDTDVSKKIGVSQYGTDSYSNLNSSDIGDDIAVKVVSATASSYQSGEGIELSYDGDYSTYYHSNWSNGASDYFPITLTYYFNEEDIDYLVYTPRTSGTNGNFSEIEIYAQTTTASSNTLIASCDLEAKSSQSKILFSESLSGVTAIEIKVLSGYGSDNGFASCAEMEFYKYNPDNFDPLTLFTDITCSELRNDITLDDITSCTTEFYKQIAYFMYYDGYDTEFRIDEFKAWQNPDIQCVDLKTNSKSLLDNPTGIVATAGEDLVVFVGDTHGEILSLKILNLNLANGDGYWDASSTYSLSTGVNKITPTNSGLIYVLYHTTEHRGADPVKIHFATGTVNGYFDTQKHDDSRWKELLYSAPYAYFDILGKYSHATFPTSTFQTYTSSGKEYADMLDDLVYKEYQLLGLEKYDKIYHNRQYFHVMYTSYMYATSYRTAYNETTLYAVCDPTTLKSDPWGPAHEVGHCHQISLAFKWIGMTEVTTNLFSMYIQQQWGNTSRLITDGVYTSAHATASGSPGIAHADHDNVFDQLVPFWQLQLYFSDVLGNTDFYPDIFENMRLNDSPTEDGVAQLDFVKYAVTSSGKDLTKFFEYWGFLTPIDKEIEDYSTRTLSITQDQVDEVKQWIIAQGYSEPAHEFWNITDSNYTSYK